MTADTRRVCDLSPAELLEAAVEGCATLGWTDGKWEITLGFEDGHLLRARVPSLVMAGRVTWVVVGRSRLDLVESTAA